MGSLLTLMSGLMRPVMCGLLPTHVGNLALGATWSLLAHVRSLCPLGALLRMLRSTCRSLFRRVVRPLRVGCLF